MGESKKIKLRPLKSFRYILVATIFIQALLLQIGHAQTVPSHHKSTRQTMMPSYETVSNDSVAHYNAKEEKIFNLVFNIPDVKQFADYLEKHSKPIRHMQLMIAGTPAKTNKYYWVKVGEDNGDMFVTHYNFYVYTNPTRIYFLDTVNDDKVIPLKQWRQRSRKPLN